MPRNESPRADGHAAARTSAADGPHNAAAWEARVTRAVANAARAADLAAVSSAETHQRAGRAHERALGIHELAAAVAEAHGDDAAGRKHRETVETERQAALLAYRSGREALRRTSKLGLR